jgi:hypothetical protein
MLKLTLALSGVVLVAVAYQPPPAIAQTTKPFYVGTCKPGKADYTTIQEAVNGVPSGSTINVCPGTYPEQVTITQPLTLSGVQSGDNAAVVVTMPSNLVEEGFYSSPLYVPVISVFNAGGPVNISGLVVDSTAVVNPPRPVVNILIDSSPGTINHVVLLAPEYGVLVADDWSMSSTVTIENSVISLANEVSVGIFESSTTSTVNVTNSYLYGLGASKAIYLQGNADTVTGNTIDLMNGAGEGILILASATVSGNTVSNSSIALFSPGSPVMTNNTLLNNKVALSSPGGGTFKGNMIVSQPAGVGVDLQCISTVAMSGNTFIGTTLALANVPGGVSLQKNAGKYFGVSTIELLCP